METNGHKRHAQWRLNAVYVKIKAHVGNKDNGWTENYEKDTGLKEKNTKEQKTYYFSYNVYS